jgi:ABC-type sugar transport system substrate-binding protein
MARMPFAYILSALMIAVAACSGGEQAARPTTSNAHNAGTSRAGVVDAIKNGTIEWAIDQQPFLQGYLAVDSLWLYFTNKNVIGGGQPKLTGPSFVDETNIDSVAHLAEPGTR